MKKTIEKTDDSMQNSMMNPSFYGEFNKSMESEPIKKECAIKGIELSMALIQ